MDNINRNNLPSLLKIKLHKECSFSKITLKANKVVALNLNELNNALGSIDVRLDGKLCVNTIFHLYSNVLNVGVKIVLRFAISDVPECIRGKVTSEDDLDFMFDIDYHH